MRLATFNLESLGSNAAGSAPLDERIAALKPQLERLDADILCLQEVNGQRPDNARPRDLIALRRLLDATIYRGHHMISTHGARKDAVSDLHNLVILSRYPITASEELRHRLVDPPLYRARTAEPAEETPQPVQWDRPLLHATLELASTLIRQRIASYSQMTIPVMNAVCPRGPPPTQPTTSALSRFRRILSTGLTTLIPGRFITWV